MLILFQGRLIEPVPPVAVDADVLVTVDPKPVVLEPTALEQDVSTLQDTVAVVVTKVDTLWDTVIVKGTTNATPAV